MLSIYIFKVNPISGVFSSLDDYIKRMAKLKRIAKELRDVYSGTNKTIALTPIEVNSDVASLRGLILAPEGAPMENYVLSLSVEIPREYPFRPPRIEFENKVWHPRVDIQSGSLCMVEISPENWDPKLKLEACLASIQHMLVEPFLDPKALVQNSEANDQYLYDRDQYYQKSKAVTAASNEAYGKICFDDHRIASIQAIYSRLSGGLADMFKYKCSIFCQRKSTYTWNLIFFIFPAVDIYKFYADKHTQQFSPRLTSFEFAFKPSELTIGIPRNSVSKDKCWEIRAVGSLLLKTNECDADPCKFKNRSPSCELSLEWKRTEIAPHRFSEKVMLNAPSSELLYLVDVTVDPNNFKALPPALNIQTCFKKLLPLAALWGNIGCLLGIDDGTLKQIEHDKRLADNCLREMLNTWLANTTQPPTWAALAEAVEPFHKHIAEELRTL